jgi:2',3'-cyclic-nucleotide 2'-phosphodiesterase (5'-nucleotidase family)
MTPIHIFHTNDFHNHLKPAQADKIQAAHAEYPGALLLDSGDAISAGNVGVRPGGEPILTLMSQLGYDAMTMGNREFHVAAALLRHKIGEARFPVLCANIRWKDDQGEPLPALPYIVKELEQGVKVGIVGVTVPMVTERMAAKALSAFLFDDPVAVVTRIAGELRPQVDVLLALTHIGLRQDERLAAACPDLDLIIGGHSHDVLTEPKIVCGVPILQAGWYGHYLGHATVVPRAGDRRAVVSDELVRIKES